MQKIIRKTRIIDFVEVKGRENILTMTNKRKRPVLANVEYLFLEVLTWISDVQLQDSVRVVFIG